MSPTMRLRHAASRLGLHLTIGVCVLVWTVPTLGLLITSLRPYEEIVRSGWWTVLLRPLEWTDWTLENFQEVLHQDGLFVAFLNSLKITLPASALALVFAAMASYAMAVLGVRGRRAFLTLFAALIVLPIQTTFVPLMQLHNALNLSGTFLGIWLVHTGYGLPLMVYLLTNFFRALPQEVLEAARIDGASHWSLFWRVVIPLSLPALASILTLHFLWMWNDLLVALIFLGTSSSVAPVTVKIVGLVGAQGENWHLLTSGAFISLVPPLIVFFALQRYFVSGLLGWQSASSVDGSSI